MHFSTPWIALVTVAATIVAGQSDPCAEFVETTHKAPSYSNLDAKLFRKCITSVPFNKDKAAATLAMIRQFMGMASSSVYYEDPTPELELQPFNINKTLDALDEKVKNGKYSNNWSFDYDVVQMFQLFRDGHMDYETICTHGYFYSHDFPVAALENAKGGLELYHVLVDRSTSVKKATLGQRIKRINGQDPGVYLAEFIKTTPEALDFIDPDARFNAMLYNWPAGHNNGGFETRKMWDGEDLRITWENGSETVVQFSVSLQYGLVDKETRDLLFKDTKSLAELCWKSDYGQTLKRRGIAVKEPATPSLKKRQTDEKKWTNPAPFPKALANSIENAASVYALPSDSSTVVLVIRSFGTLSTDGPVFIRAFSQFLQDELAEWKSKGYQRLIIDLTSNPGGKAILPFDALKQFFPNSEEFLTVNMAYSPLTWAYMASLGDAYKTWQRLDGTEFENMKDYLGPVRKDGALFTKMWQQDYVRLGEGTYGLTMTSYPSTNPFLPDDIVIVSDAMCSSACASFVEGMQTRGVRAYAYGGRPTNDRPMQAVGGTKGGKAIDFKTLKTRLDDYTSDETVASIAGDPKDWILPEPPINLDTLRVNTENKFRKGYSLPMHFLYVPACNRFYLTKEMWGDATKMWNKVREMAWDKDGKMVKCKNYVKVKGSKMPSYSNNGVGNATSAEGYDAFDEGEALDGTGRASKNDPNAPKRDQEKTYRNLGQVIWEHMGRK
ncbi:hypothetical protein EX30DRAFT_396419 [Ascodesmis nigricans]|uniref:Uncharacterized protein n=1 Tax=Ascodesmis nigricans TaxID=341454 RepID=A0A4S2MV70_9PEZI|nr:hypothetical protein EX30DRAFT_396419 [Ascodesmis nigricans]